MTSSANRKKRLGLIVNPIAGMGGRVGLKGTDGTDIVDEARLLGATPESPKRASEALRIVAKIRDDIELYCYPQEMGESEARGCGFSPTVIGSIESNHTTSEDTQRAAKEMRDLRLDLLLFAGGDGTARDIYRAIGSGDKKGEERIASLGIPAGVKMHSAVFATTPRSAGEAAVEFLTNSIQKVTEAEIMDIDEISFREGVVTARLYGYLRVPEERQFMQSAKSGGIQTTKQIIQGIAEDLRENWEKDSLYIFGPGTTTRDILVEYGLPKTLLGVDVVSGGRIVARDANEAELARWIDENKRKNGTGTSKIVVTVIGQQGYIFGRGNQQLSPEIVKKVGKENIIVVASKEKLASLEGRPLLVDTGNAEVDRMLSGYVRVITGFNDYVVYKVAS